MSYTLATAAAATGLNKSAILWAIKLGKISAAKDQHGEWQIEPVDLHLTYPPVAPQRYAPPHAAAIAEAHQQVAMLQAVLEVMKADRDGWRDQARRLLLADQRNRRPWWRRLAGGWVDRPRRSRYPMTWATCHLLPPGTLTLAGLSATAAALAVMSDISVRISRMVSATIGPSAPSANPQGRCGDPSGVGHDRRPSGLLQRVRRGRVRKTA
jgi:hypothetical protein